MTKSKKKKKKELTPNDILKYEIAEELGLMEKVKETGWSGLTARETGMIGGIMTSRKKQKQQQEQEKNQKKATTKEDH